MYAPGPCQKRALDESIPTPRQVVQRTAGRVGVVAMMDSSGIWAAPDFLNGALLSEKSVMEACKFKEGVGPKGAARFSEAEMQGTMNSLDLVRIMGTTPALNDDKVLLPHASQCQEAQEPPILYHLNCAPCAAWSNSLCRRHRHA